MEKKRVVSEQLCCPVCHRDYELPRRYMIQKGDYDFSPIPRMLPCLHDACHSCIEEQYQNSNGKIDCSLCHRKEPINGVIYLPLDISILTQVVQCNSSELLAYCGRCYDSVSSISWCETCSSALCEFHHQDHKLSVDTAKHAILTFKEYLRQEKHIEFQFPPISCPECPMQDCSLYCHTCGYLISTKAFVDFHKSHEVVDFTAVIPNKRDTIENAVIQSKYYSSSLHSKIIQIKQFLSQLDENEETLSQQVHHTFLSLHNQLKQREKELKDKIQQFAGKKRSVLMNQLSLLGELCEESEYVKFVGEQVLQNTANTLNEAMYLISTSQCIDHESDRIADLIDEKLQGLLVVNPLIRLDVLSEDLQVIIGTINKLGGVLENHIQSLEQPLAYNDTSKQEKDDDDPGVAAASLPSIQFSVFTRLEDLEDHPDNNNNMTQNCLILEARLFLPDDDDDKIDNKGEKDDDTTRSSSNKQSSSNREEEKEEGIELIAESKSSSSSLKESRNKSKHNQQQGILIGKIELQDLIESQLIKNKKKHKIKNVFESHKEGIVSILTITKEIVGMS